MTVHDVDLKLPPAPNLAGLFRGHAIGTAWLLLTACLVSVGLLAYGFRPIAPTTDITIASFAVLLCFPLLIAERAIAAIGPRRAALRRFAMLPIFCLLVAAAAYLAAAAGLPAMRPAAVALAVLLGVVTLELGIRTGFALLQPMRLRDRDRAIDLLVLRPFGMKAGRRSWAARLRENFGIDFARSWALRFFSRALLPIGAFLMALCVVLTGLVRIDTTERGLYLRLGRPVAVLKPGLHLLLPWPLGEVRRVEYGVIHAVPISFGTVDPSSDAQLVAALASSMPPTAEGPPPASANRLWDSTQPSDVTYLIASDDSSGTAQRRGGFELVSVSMRVLYRIGLDSASARHAATAVADPATLVRMQASQLLARHLATRTLPQILVEDRGDMARSLGAKLQIMLDHLGTGIEILNIAVEAAHPPAGAAAAYRQVQAAEIGAQTAISVERGRAETIAGLAGRDATEAVGRAQADAAEFVARSQAQRTAMQANEDSYRASPGAFRLENRFSALQGAFATGDVDILDPRLDLSTPPTLDLRQPERTNSPSANQGTLP